MAISPDLMKAILSLDTYNRGYDAGINTLPTPKVQRGLGFIK